MFSHCTSRSVLRICCPASRTKEIVVQWKRPAAAARARPESSLCVLPLTTAGLREPRWQHHEEGANGEGVVGGWGGSLA